MNLRNTCPDIPDDWKGGISETSRLLGIDRKTVRKYTLRLRARCMVNAAPDSAAGRIRISGAEAKMIWHLL